MLMRLMTFGTNNNLLKEDTLFLMSYYHNPTFQNGEWIFLMQSCKDEYIARFPEIQFQKASFQNHVRYMINWFVRTGSLRIGKSNNHNSINTSIKIITENWYSMKHISQYYYKRFHMCPYHDMSTLRYRSSPCVL